MKIRYSPFL